MCLSSGRKRRRRAGQSAPFSRCVLCPRTICDGTKKSLQTNKGGRSAERRVVSAAPRYPSVPLCGVAARAPFGRRARLPRSTAALAEFLGLAQSGPALHGSANGSLRPPPGQPAPGRPASWQAGRVSEPPAGRVTAPPEDRSCSASGIVSRSVPHNSTSRIENLYRKRGHVVNTKVTYSHETHSEVSFVV